jgi:hypothetical protein
MDYKKDYYQILELSSTASREEIRASFRRLAKLYHPDRNPGDTTAEEKFKQINEANEILSNDIMRQEYDGYRLEQQRWEEEQAAKERAGDHIKSSNKKTYTKTKTVVSETRIYIRGEITVKYWADCEERLAPGFNTELDYKINPTEVLIKISEQNIFPVQGIPLDYLKAFKESDLFAVPLAQPIRCEVIGDSGTEYFELVLKDIRIKNIKLAGVTKHENSSYGTLTGQFYGYSPKFTSEEIQETVTECFGETGNVERKEENGFSFIRKEYYHPDCSRFWGTWIQLPKSRPSTWRTQPARKYAYSSYTNSVSTGPGCGVITWIFAFFAILFLMPKFFIFCAVLAGLGLLLHFGNRIFYSFGRFFSFLSAGLFLLFLIVAVRSFNKTGTGYVKQKERPNKVKSVTTVRQSPIKDSTGRAADSLINHFLQWTDYEGKLYEGNFAVAVSAVNAANVRHSRMSRNFYQDMSEIYRSMMDYDSAYLGYIYQTFDSIRSVNKLDEIQFSQVLVSAIQSQPYFLVLDKGCNEKYSDDFTRNYLANCKTDCCVGNELFGVRSPLEFLSDLKGDCDTRSLLLYQLLKHYDYNVALLTSNQYKHAMIAVNFAQSTNQPGLGITIGDDMFYMWETTNPNLDYGDISSNFNNLSYWDIALINKKIQHEVNP